MAKILDGFDRGHESSHLHTLTERSALSIGVGGSWSPSQTWASGPDRLVLRRPAAWHVSARSANTRWTSPLRLNIEIAGRKRNLSRRCWHRRGRGFWGGGDPVHRGHANRPSGACVLGLL